MQKARPERPGLFDDGGAERDRTADLYNAIVALSQLSYGPIRWSPEEEPSGGGWNLGRAGPGCKGKMRSRPRSGSAASC